MTALLVPAATEQDWLAARRRGITASEIAVILGLAPPSQDSPFALYHRKRGDLPELEDSDALERGRVLEPYIAGKFAALHPEFAVAGDGRELYAHPLREWQLATPDRRLHDIQGTDAESYSPDAEPVAVLECKTDAGEDIEVWGEDGSDDIPVHYRCQVLWQMDVLGVDTGYVACLAMRSWRIRVYQLHLDERAREDLSLMRREAREFRSRLDLAVPPDVDWRPPTTAALKRLHPGLKEDTEVAVTTQLARWYLAACRNLKAAERRKALYENRIREQLGAGHRAVDRRTGQVVAVRQVYPVREHTRKASTVDKLVPKQPKEPT